MVLLGPSLTAYTFHHPWEHRVLDSVVFTAVFVQQLPWKKLSGVTDLQGERAGSFGGLFF